MIKLFHSNINHIISYILFPLFNIFLFLYLYYLIHFSISYLFLIIQNSIPDIYYYHSIIIANLHLIISNLIPFILDSLIKDSNYHISLSILLLHELSLPLILHIFIATNLFHFIVTQIFLSISHIINAMVEAPKIIIPFIVFLPTNHPSLPSHPHITVTNFKSPLFIKQ